MTGTTASAYRIRGGQMRKFSRFGVLILLAVFAAAPVSSAQKWTKKSLKSAKPATAKASEVQQLRDALAAQQQQLEQQRQQMDRLRSQLQQLVDASQQANANAQKSQSSADQAQSAASRAQHMAIDAQRQADQASANAVEAKTALTLVNDKSKEEDKKLKGLTDVVGRFRCGGDVRVRGESLFH